MHIGFTIYSARTCGSVPCSSNARTHARPHARSKHAGWRHHGGWQAKRAHVRPSRAVRACVRADVRACEDIRSVRLSIRLRWAHCAHEISTSALQPATWPTDLTQRSPQISYRPTRQPEPMSLQHIQKLLHIHTGCVWAQVRVQVYLAVLVGMLSFRASTLWRRRVHKAARKTTDCCCC